MKRVLVSIMVCLYQKLTSSGFYKSSYVNDSGEKKYMACTQMEPTDARRVSSSLVSKYKKSLLIEIGIPLL